jgi:hypothetical protein
LNFSRHSLSWKSFWPEHIVTSCANNAQRRQTEHSPFLNTEFFNIIMLSVYSRLFVDCSTVPIKEKTMGIKPGPKRIADSTGEPDRRQRDNKKTPGNTPPLKPHKHKKGD